MKTVVSVQIAMLYHYCVETYARIPSTHMHKNWLYKLSSYTFPKVNWLNRKIHFFTIPDVELDIVYQIICSSEQLLFGL